MPPMSEPARFFRGMRRPKDGPARSVAA
jgi:hypothetical protein